MALPLAFLVAAHKLTLSEHVVPAAKQFIMEVDRPPVISKPIELLVLRQNLT
jgi:hypothetical protein